MADFSFALIWIAIAVAVIVIAVLSHRAKTHKLELIHQERLVAMEKGIPLPELPVDLPWGTPPPRPPNPNAALITGVVFAAVGIGIMIVLFLTLPDIPVEGLPHGPHTFWVLPLPLALVGVGLILYHYFLRDQTR